MKLFDIVGGKVAIHTDALGIPCFRAIWDSHKDKKVASDIISYIVLNNHPDSPYVTSLYEADRLKKLNDELFDGKLEKDEQFEYAEKSYIEFLDTLPLKLLRGLRRSLESISKYLDTAKSDTMDMRMVKDILSAAAMTDKAIKSINTLEKQVRKDELESSTVRGGSEIGHFEIPKSNNKPGSVKTINDKYNNG